MTAITKTKKRITDVNLYSPKDTFIYVARKRYARNLVIDWKNKDEIQWGKYQIKETDMRTKTATFTTNQYLDLTTGQYCVLITSPAHEDFGGIIIDVEYDNTNGMYSYQCQDFSRNYQSKFEAIWGGYKTYNIIQFLISRGELSAAGNSKKKLKEYKRILSGLRPAWQYWERAWGGLIDYNPMTTNQKVIIRNKSYIEALRDLIYGLDQLIDVYFDKYGVIHIEPFVKDEWLHTGLQLTTPEIASAKYKFDTTNVITATIVHNMDKDKGGHGYTSQELLNLDLSAFFGKLTSSVDNPNQKKTNTKNTSKKSNKTQNQKVNNIYGTRNKIVYLNSDNIDGYSSDYGKMEDMKKLLEKEGWKVTIAGVGSEAHYERRGEVDAGIWFCLYGGICAGTLKEHCTSDWFLNPLKNRHSRVVVGFFPPVTCGFLKGCNYYEHLGPAHDWQGNQAYANIDYPGKFLSEWGIPWMYAGNAKEMVAKFLAGGDNYKTDGNSYKYYDSWQKHNPNWL